MPRNTMHPAVQRFRIAIPAATHRDPASCEDVDCTNYLGGWTMKVDTGTKLGQDQASYLRLNLRGLQFSVVKNGDYEVEFIYPPGQRCFDEHTVLNGREPFYLHETSAGRRVHTPEGFMEHAHEQIAKNIGLEDRRNG